MVIRVDRRALYFLVGVLLLGVPLLLGLYLGGFMGKPAAPNQAAATPAGPGSAPVAQAPAASGGANGAPGSAAPASDPAQAQQAADLAAVPRISIDDAKKKLGDAGTVFIDARTPDQFAQGHIKGAISIPEMDAVAKSSDLPKDKDLIIYCT
jgi:hypothetical protein